MYGFSLTRKLAKVMCQLHELPLESGPLLSFCYKVLSKSPVCTSEYCYVMSHRTVLKSECNNVMSHCTVLK